jgi:pimeloyl-ACP methyl ester carboxylesterase
MDLVLIPEWASHIEGFWEESRSARQLRRRASFSRLIMFDRRGVGLSDPVAHDHLPTLEETMDDLRAVMDAAGSDRAALMSVSEGGPIPRHVRHHLPRANERACVGQQLRSAFSSSGLPTGQG